MKKSEFKELVSKLTAKQLTKHGFRKWDNKKPTLMLIPKELYGSIPNGFELTTIFGKKEKFKNGVTDNDSRFGMLAYGVLK
jgi:hypothetical protein